MMSATKSVVALRLLKIHLPGIKYFLGGKKKRCEADSKGPHSAGKNSTKRPAPHSCHSSATSGEAQSTEAQGRCVCTRSHQRLNPQHDRHLLPSVTEPQEQTDFCCQIHSLIFFFSVETC